MFPVSGPLFVFFWFLACLAAVSFHGYCPLPCLERLPLLEHVMLMPLMPRWAWILVRAPDAGMVYLKRAKTVGIRNHAVVMQWGVPLQPSQYGATSPNSKDQSGFRSFQTSLGQHVSALLLDPLGSILEGYIIRTGAVPGTFSPPVASLVKANPTFFLGRHLATLRRNICFKNRHRQRWASTTLSK